MQPFKLMIYKKLFLLSVLMTWFNNSLYSVADFSTTFKPIETARLILRILELKDAQDCFAILSDIRIVCMNASLVSPHTHISQSEQFIKDAQQQYQENIAQWLAIEEKSSKRMIGIIGFDDYAPKYHRAGLDYAIVHDAWGRGYATEASRVLLDLGFNHMNLNRIFATVDPENIGSIRVIEKLGMKLEGYLRQNVFHNNKFSDRRIYSILKSEWIAQKNYE